MTKHLFFLYLLLITTSCTTITNSPVQVIEVNSLPDTISYYLNNNQTRFVTPGLISLKRSSNDIPFRIENDTVDKIFVIKSRISDEYIFGNIASLGYGYIVDLFDKRRYTYPKKIVIDTETLQIETKYNSTFSDIDVNRKHSYEFRFSIPIMNWMLTETYNGYFHDRGPLGITGGLGYYITDKFKLSTNIGWINSSGLEFESFDVTTQGIEHSKICYGIFVNLQAESYYKRINYGAGIQYSEFFFGDLYKEYQTAGMKYWGNTLEHTHVKRNLGFIFSGSFSVTNNYYIGGSYNPSFFSWENKHFKTGYSQFFSIEMGFKWKFPLK